MSTRMCLLGCRRTSHDLVYSFFCGWAELTRKHDMSDHERWAAMGLNFRDFEERKRICCLRED